MNESTDGETLPVDMEASTYSQILFNDVPHSYPPNTPVTCCYTLTAGLQPNPRDWVAVFKVGWSTTQSYHNYVWVEPSLDRVGPEHTKQQVVFNDYYLPKDDGEFYQFCYVDSSGQVRGASTPFCFKSPGEECLDSLEKDLLVITTQEQLEQMVGDKDALQKEVDQLKVCNQILKSELAERLQEMHRLRVTMEQRVRSMSQPELQPLTGRDPKSAEPVMQISDTAAADDAKPGQESLTPLQEKYERAVQKINQLKKERAELTARMEDQEKEIALLGPRGKAAEQQWHRLQDHVQLLQVDLQSSRKDNEKLRAELLGVRKELEEVQSENKALRETMSAQGPQDGDGGTTQVQIEALCRQLQEASAQLRQEIRSSNEARRRADRAEQELRKAQEQQQQQGAASVDEREQQSVQAEMQLKEALQKIDKQTDILEMERMEKEQLSVEKEEIKVAMEGLHKELADLQASISMENRDLHNPPSPVPNTPVQEHLGYEIPGSPTDMDMDRVLVCQHCHERFPGISLDELAFHEQNHKVCPYCTLICDSMEQTAYEDHVYSHEE